MTAPIAVQLYTLRDHIDTDPSPMFDRLAQAGLVGVESAGMYGRTAEQYGAALRAAGLELCSAHIGIDPRSDRWRDDFAAELDAHRTAGATRAVVPMLFPNQFSDLDRVARSAELLNAANDIARSRDMSLGYHNHFWEFVELDGRHALNHLFDRCDPSLFAEIDIYWATVGGVDAATLVADLGDRVRLLHIKDGPADSHESAMVAVGQGAVPIADIVHAAPAAEWHIIELDRCETDMVDAVIASHDFLATSGLSTSAR